MRRAALIAILAAATMGGSCSSDKNNQTLFLATLSPDNEVPARASSASGVARITFDGTTVTFLVTANNFENYTMGHIHSGAAGVNGPVRVFLYGPSAPASLAGGTLVQSSFTASDMVGGFDFNALIEEMRAGTAYVNFHTTRYPGGEIRGQVQLLN